MKENRKHRGKKIDQVVFPVAESISDMPVNYLPFFFNLKEFIRKEKFQTILNVNQRMILMYWHIGKSILEMQQKEGWGAKIIDRLSKDLKEAFPEETGFSPRNLKYMRKFAEAWTDFEIVQRTVAQIPWRSNITLLDKQKDRLVAEYTLSGINNPIGISNWQNEIMKSFPDYLKSSLPTIEEIENEFANEDEL
jgi:hypothetical protein